MRNLILAIFTLVAATVSLCDAQQEPCDLISSPCTCDSTDNSVTCDQAYTEDDLVTAFQGVTNVTVYNTFSIQGSNITTISSNVFANAQFKAVTLQETLLNYLDATAFENSQQTLASLTVPNNRLDDVGFPFASIPNYSVLGALDLEFNSFTVMPSISSSSLLFLNIGYNSIPTLTASGLSGAPNLQAFFMSSAAVTMVEQGSFANNNLLFTVLLNINNLQTLVNGTFQGLIQSVSIFLDNNLISDIEISAFEGVSNSIINLDYNLLTELSETWLRPVLEAGNSVQTEFNPLVCGCDLAWLFANPSLMSGLDAGSCANGTAVASLDSNYFVNNC